MLLADRDMHRLQVANTRSEDAGRGLAHLPRQAMRWLQVEEGDVVEIVGKRSTTARAVYPYPEDDGLDIVRLDGLQRANAGVGSGDFIELRKVEAKSAVRVVLAPAQQSQRLEGPTSALRRAFMGRPLCQGDVIATSGQQRIDQVPEQMRRFLSKPAYALQEIRLVVVDTTPSGIVNIDEDTALELLPEYTTQEKYEASSAGDISVLAGPLSSEALSLQSAPLIAAVRSGQIIIEPAPLAHSATPPSSLSAARLENLSEAKRIAALSHNLGPGFSSRLARITDLLSNDPDVPSIIRLGIQIRSLREMTSLINQSMLTENASDVLSFLDELNRFSRQFRDWRQFEAEASDEVLPSENEQAALIDTVDALERNASDYVSDPVRQVLSELRDAQDGTRDVNIARGYRKAVANIFRAIGTYLRDRVAGIGKEFGKSIDEAFGKGLAKALAATVIGAAASLTLLAAAHPVEFGWVTLLIEAAKRIAAFAAA